MSSIPFFIVSLMFRFIYMHTNGETNPEEVQHAICQIFTKDLEASANATITRQLKGVCTTEDLNFKFQELEQRIFQRFDVLQKLITKNVCKKDIRTVKSYIKKIQDDFDEETFKLSNNTSNDLQINEILKHNDTINAGNQGSIYTYFWKIPNIHQVLHKSDLYITSPNFNIFGHSLQLQFYPNYPERNHFAIQLKPASKGFIKKHKLLILCQSGNVEDIQSDLLTGVNVKFQLSTESIKQECFIDHVNLIVGVQIHLDS